MSTPVLLRRLRSVHECLEAAGYDHALGGALALAVHAEPRFTADIDLNVIADPERSAELLAVLPKELDPAPDAARVLKENGQARLYWSEPVTPLDLFLPQHETYHLLVAERAVPYAFPGFDVKVITATDLMVFKTLFGRSKDFVDIETLGEHGAGDIDDAVAWVRRILGPGTSGESRLRESWERGWAARRS